MARLPVSYAPDGSGALYEVKRGDTFYGLIKASGTLSLMEPKAAIELVMQDNPHIINADRVFPGDLVFIRSRNAVGKSLSSTTKVDIRAAHQELPSVARLNVGGGGPGINWAAMSATVSFAGSGAAAQQLSNIHSSAAKPVNEIIDSYKQWKAGEISRKAHYEARSGRIRAIKQHLGGLEKKVLGGPAGNSLRMTSGGGRGIDRTLPLKNQVARLSTTARNLSRGAAALNVVSVVVDAGFTHYAVCTADYRVGKNQAFVGGLGGTIFGGLAGAGGGAVAGTVFTAGFVFFIGSNPAGWVVGLAIVGGAAIGAGLGSWGGSAAAVKAYDTFGNGYDVVDAIPINGGCKIWE